MPRAVNHRRAWLQAVVRVVEDSPARAVTRFLRSVKLAFANGRRTGSDLDRPIAPEIRDDELCRLLEQLAATEGVGLVLEIGASSGEGSTEALVRGALRNPVTPQLHTIEVSRVRFERLAGRYRAHGFVHCHNVSSVPLARFPSRAEVERFHREVPSRLQRIPLEEVLRWLDQDVAYLEEHGLAGTAGIQQIKREHGIDLFDLVLIDGSEFTGAAELAEVYGARFIALDDTRSYKNFISEARLLADPRYRLLARSADLREGFAVFERV